MRATAQKPKPAAPGYSVEAERALMRWIGETCGREITEATGGDAAKTALLAAITANESGGCRGAYRFDPGNHQRLLGLLAGVESNVDGLTRSQLEKRLKAAASDAERGSLMKKLAGLHGYTGLAGYHTILWKAPLEALVDKGRHFELATRRLQELCREHTLDPATQAVEVGRLWNAGSANGRTRAALYSWRLRERMKLWGEWGV